MKAVVAESIIVDSANAAVTTVATDAFAKLTNHTLNWTISDLARHVSADDRPGLFSPVEVEQEGKDRLGAVLALEDRVIVAWTVGVLRMRHYERVITYGSIECLELTTRPGGPMSKDRDVLRITADGTTWNLVFANVFDGGRRIAPFIEGLLAGSINRALGTD